MSRADEHCDGLLAAYVLGACPPTEADGVARHLAHCASCAAVAERLREGVEAVRGDVRPAAPAAGVKERVMAQVRAEARLFEAARASGSEPRESPRSSQSRWSLPRARLWTPIPAAALACVLTLLAVGAGLLSMGILAGAPQRDVAAAQIEEGQARGAAGSLEIDGEGAELRVRGLRAPGRGRIYQVWVRKDRQVPEPAGAVLEVDSDGVAHTRLPGDIRRFDQVLVTSEPARGSRLPTRVPVLDVETPA